MTIKLVMVVSLTGVVDGKEAVLTKLGRNRDIKHWEHRLCLMAHEPDGCDVSHAANKALMNSGTDWMTDYLKGVTNFTACPTDRLIEKIMDRYHEKLDAVDMSARERIQLISTLMLNQEPVVFQTFPRSEGWPFPAYLGACGRFVAIESGLKPLHEFYDEPFTDRARLALKLLNIARKFTDNKSQYGIYFTNIGYGSFAVDQKTGDVLVVDGRTLMVVDLYQVKEDKKSDWDEPLYCKFEDCSS